MDHFQAAEDDPAPCDRELPDPEWVRKQDAFQTPDQPPPTPRSKPLATFAVTVIEPKVPNLRLRIGCSGPAADPTRRPLHLEALSLRHLQRFGQPEWFERRCRRGWSACSLIEEASARGANRRCAV